MKKLLLILLCLPFIGFGQEWTFGGTNGDFGHSVQQTTDGGYIICGYTYSFGNGDSDFYLIKTDGNGDSLWTKTFGGTGFDFGSSVQQTTDGGYILTGGKDEDDIWLIKTDNSGNLLWDKTFGGTGYDFGSSVQQTTDGGYIITGNTESFGNGDSDVYLIKTDGNGVEQWSQTFGGTGDYYGRSVQQTTDGGYIITGWRSIQNGVINLDSSNVYLIKTDGSGVEQWSQTFGGGYDGGYSVQQTTDGGYIITGFNGLSGSNGALVNVYLIKTDGSGIEQWSQTFGGVDNGEGYSVQQTTDGGYIITGWRQIQIQNGVINLDSSNVYLIKTDGSGVEQWSQTFGGGYDGGYSVQQTTDGGYIIAGTKSNFVNGVMTSDVYLIKTDGSGNVTSTFNIPINPNRKLQKTVDFLGRESKPKKNIPFIEIYDDGTVEKRIVIE